MSKSATASTSKSPPQLPSKSAWARGPLQNSVTTTRSSPQSPAPPTPVSVTNPANFHAAQSRRSSALGQGNSISDTLNVPRSVVKQESAVTFGSIDDVSAPISSSPASSPAVRPADSVKSFGSVAVQNGVSDAAETAVINPLPLSSTPSTSPSHPALPSTSTTSPVPKFDKKSIAELFRDPSTQSVPTPTMYYHRPQLVPGVPPYQFYPPQSSSHLVPPWHQPPPPHHSPGAGPPSAPHPPPSVTSPPPTSSAPNRSCTNVCAFIPGKKISIKYPSGQEVDLDTLKHVSPAAVPSVPPSLASVKKGKKKRGPIRIESQEQKEKRLAEEKARESEEKSKISGTFAKANDDAAHRQIEEQELRKVEEPRLKEEVERAEKERKEAEEQAARSASIGFLPGSMGKSAGSEFQMGQFSTSANKVSSEERFLAAGAGCSASVSGGPLGGRPPTMVHTNSRGGSTNSRGRTCNNRDANDFIRASVVSNAGLTSLISNVGPPMGAVTPLEVSAFRWVATSTRRGGSRLNSKSPVVVERKVKALLNKLTMERFDSISDQIIAWANKSEKEKDGRTLIQVIKLVFENAVDQETFSEMYARLCRKMMEQISPKVQDHDIKNSEGKPFAGGNLFRKYLLNRCQDGFECGWVAMEGEEWELYSDEYYAAAKAKRRGLGLIRFICEIFRLQMLTERIMHECIKKLLGNVENPEEGEIESLCKLLTTVGSLLDRPKARGHVDLYFSRMRELTKNQNLKARMVFMLQDVIELRERKWVPRNIVVAPMTIAQVHEAAAKEELDLAGAGSARAQRKAGDLSQPGKLNLAAPMSFLTSVFNSKKALFLLPLVFLLGYRLGRYVEKHEELYSAETRRRV